MGSINVRTSASDEQLLYHLRTVSTANVQVLCMQETRRLGYGVREIPIVRDDGRTDVWEIHWQGHRSKKEHGIAIAYVKSFRIKMNQVSPISERILIANLEYGATKIKLLCGYAPTDCSDDKLKSGFWSSL